MPKKYTYEQVKNFFYKEGWTLLSKEYKDNKQKLEVLCENGHKLQINLNNFLTGWRCRECSGRRYLNYEIVKSDFEAIGYTLLEKEYINTVTKLKFKCDKGHIHQMSYADLCSGRKCGKCSNLYNNNPFFIFNTPIKRTPEQVALFVQNEGYKLLHIEYKNQNLTITIECPAGHTYTTKFYDFKKGHRCRKCFESINGENHHFWKGGLPKCIDCGKELSAYTVKRCDKCKGNLENNPNWQGGIGFFPYSIDFTKKLKEKIRERDNRICQGCGKSEKDNNNRKLDVHHIDYDKENCDETNLISLCKICHIKSNYNRDYWYAYYTYLMENFK